MDQEPFTKDEIRIPKDDSHITMYEKPFSNDEICTARYEKPFTKDEIRIPKDDSHIRMYEKPFSNDEIYIAKYEKPFAKVKSQYRKMK